MLLARLFAKPANVIVLDEPTNDLDTETLELLEERLVEYAGTVLLVSHDRAFLNNVVTSTIVFEATARQANTSAATTTGCGSGPSCRRPRQRESRRQRGRPLGPRCHPALRPRGRNALSRSSGSWKACRP